MPNYAPQAVRAQTLGQNQNCPCANCQQQRQRQMELWAQSQAYPGYGNRLGYQNYARNDSTLEAISRELSNAQNIYQQVSGILDDFQ
jgi:hypothetical protein